MTGKLLMFITVLVTWFAIRYALVTELNDVEYCTRFC
jgi:hypothetical protein